MLRFHPNQYIFTRISREAFVQSNDAYHVRHSGGYKLPVSGLTPEQTGECYDKLATMSNLMYMGDEHHWIDERNRSKRSKSLEMLGIPDGFMTRNDIDCPIDKFIKKKKGFFIIHEVSVGKKGDVRVIYYHLNAPSDRNPHWDRPTVPQETFDLYKTAEVGIKRIAKIKAIVGESEEPDPTDLDADKVFKWKPLRTKEELAGWVKCNVYYQYASYTNVDDIYTRFA